MSDLRFDDFAVRVATDWDLGYEAGYKAAQEAALPVPAQNHRYVWLRAWREHLIAEGVDPDLLLVPEAVPVPALDAEWLREVLEDLIGLAHEAMWDANRDGGEYDRVAELAPARAALAALREGETK